MPMTREQFNEALWRSIGMDNLKTVVDGVKSDVGKAFGFDQGQTQRPSTPPPGGGGSWGGQPAPSQAGSSWSPPEDAWTPGEWTPRNTGASLSRYQVPQSSAEWSSMPPGGGGSWGETTRPEPGGGGSWDATPETVAQLQNQVFDEPTSTPAPTAAIPTSFTAPTPEPTADPWAAAFAAEHGRAPTSYDAMVKGEMDKWIQNRYAPSAPGRSDWERLTTSLNRRGVYGPRDVPDYVPASQRQAATPQGAATTPQAIGFDGNTADRYFQQEFRAKQGQPHPLEGQGQMVITTAQQNGIDPTLLLATIEIAGQQGKQVRDAQAVATLVQGMKGWTPSPEVKAIQNNINRYYGEQSASQQAPQAQPVANASLQTYGQMPITVQGAASVNPQGIEQYISDYYANSPLKGQGQSIYQIATRYGIDPATLLAIMEKENGMLTVKGVGTEGNNPGSIVYNDRSVEKYGGVSGQPVPGQGGLQFLRFATPEQGIEAMAKLLRDEYIARGKDTYQGLTEGGYSGKMDSPTWGSEVGQIANSIRQKYGAGR